MLASGSTLAIVAAFGAMAIVLGLAMLLMRALRSGLATADRNDVHGGDIVQALPIAVAYFDTNNRLRRVNSELLQLLPVAHALGDKEISMHWKALVLLDQSLRVGRQAGAPSVRALSAI